MSLEAKLTEGMKKSAKKMGKTGSERKSVRIEKLDNEHHMVTEETNGEYPGKRTGHKSLGSAMSYAKSCLGGGDGDKGEDE